MQAQDAARERAAQRVAHGERRPPIRHRNIAAQTPLASAEGGDDIEGVCPTTHHTVAGRLL
ncbi:MAG: hypothetical protein ACPIOQ_20110 [Promethearchaeia archaeon]